MIYAHSLLRGLQINGLLISWLWKGLFSNSCRKCTEW